MTLTLLDGGTGRELQRMGAPFRQPEWSALALIEAPEAVTAVHRRYLDAGADVITANSYAVTPFHIGEDLFRTDGRRLADLAGRLGRAAIGAGPGRLAGSLSPVLGSYRPDLFTPEQAEPILIDLIAGLEPHVDLWLAETLGSIAEAETVARLLARKPDAAGSSRRQTLPLWLSFTLQDDVIGSAPALRSGEAVADAARAALSLGAQALLFNCSQPEVMLAAVTAARQVIGDAGLLIGVYANAFPPQTAEATANDGLDPIREDLTPARYARFAKDWSTAGATLLGGCCGVGPEHIAELAAARSRGDIG